MKALLNKSVALATLLSYVICISNIGIIDSSAESSKKYTTAIESNALGRYMIEVEVNEKPGYKVIKALENKDEYFPNSHQLLYTMLDNTAPEAVYSATERQKVDILYANDEIGEADINKVSDLSSQLSTIADTEYSTESKKYVEEIEVTPSDALNNWDIQCEEVSLTGYDVGNICRVTSSGDWYDLSGVGYVSWKSKPVYRRDNYYDDVTMYYYGGSEASYKAVGYYKEIMDEDLDDAEFAIDKMYIRSDYYTLNFSTGSSYVEEEYNNDETNDGLHAVFSIKINQNDRVDDLDYKYDLTRTIAIGALTKCMADGYSQSQSEQLSDELKEKYNTNTYYCTRRKYVGDTSNSTLLGSDIYYTGGRFKPTLGTTYYIWFDKPVSIDYNLGTILYGVEGSDEVDTEIIEDRLKVSGQAYINPNWYEDDNEISYEYTYPYYTVDKYGGIECIVNKEFTTELNVDGMRLLRRSGLNTYIRIPEVYKYTYKGDKRGSITYTDYALDSGYYKLKILKDITPRYIIEVNKVNKETVGDKVVYTDVEASEKTVAIVDIKDLTDIEYWSDSATRHMWEVYQGTREWSTKANILIGKEDSGFSIFHINFLNRTEKTLGDLASQHTWRPGAEKVLVNIQNEPSGDMLYYRYMVDNSLTDYNTDDNKAMYLRCNSGINSIGDVYIFNICTNASAEIVDDFLEHLGGSNGLLKYTSNNSSGTASRLHNRDGTGEPYVYQDYAGYTNVYFDMADKLQKGLSIQTEWFETIPAVDDESEPTIVSHNIWEENTSAVLDHLLKYTKLILNSNKKLPSSWILVGSNIEWNTKYDDNEHDIPFNLASSLHPEEFIEDIELGIDEVWTVSLFDMTFNNKIATQKVGTHVEKWRYSQQEGYYDNELGTASFSKIWIEAPVDTFDKPGLYRVNYKRKDNPLSNNSLTDKFSDYRKWSTNYDL